MKKPKQLGFALTELIVVIVIIGILAAIASLAFSNMQLKANVERHTRELFTELQTARSDSIFRKTSHSIVISSTSDGYGFRRYSSVNENRITGGLDNPLVGVPPQYGLVFSKSTPTTYSKADGSSAANQIIQFDNNGYWITRGTLGAPLDVVPGDKDAIRVDPVNSGASVDCVVIEESRTNLGQMVGGNCVQK